LNAPHIQRQIQEDGSLVITFSGDWRIGTDQPCSETLKAWLESARPGSIQLVGDHLGTWDSSLLTFLLRLFRLAEDLGITIHAEKMPQGVYGMIALSKAVPERQDAVRQEKPNDFLTLVGEHAIWVKDDFFRLADFVGEVCIAFGRLLIGKSRMRWSDVMLQIQECGPNALAIISLIGFLMGMILAFVGAVQLKVFGAQLLIADLVGLAMAREMGAMMTSILMAGRTGSAFAAELGSMIVNDEVDALKTSGFSPIEFLVLPRILAMFFTIPFLCLFADILGIFGGSIVAAALFDVSIPEYFQQLNSRMRLIDLEVGIGKCAVFGVLVAVAGCFRGLQCQRNAASVGLATTSAVVTGIVFIVVSDAVMTMMITALDLLRR
jgi:phospholipid/cholesterol/gamma-HCH transport system permease protein